MESIGNPSTPVEMVVCAANGCSLKVRTRCVRNKAGLETHNKRCLSPSMLCVFIANCSQKELFVLFFFYDF